MIMTFNTMMQYQKMTVTKKCDASFRFAFINFHLKAQTLLILRTSDIIAT